jgi:hypothetical protein
MSSTFVVVEGPPLASSPIGKLDQSSFTFAESAWVDTEDAVVEVAAPTVRDVTGFVREKGGMHASPRDHVFLSASFNVYLTGDRCIAPALPLSNMIILYQNISNRASGQPSSYGTTFVRVAVATALVNKIAHSMRRLNMHVADPPVAKSRIVDDYTIFQVNLNQCRVGYTEMENGHPKFVQCDDLTRPLSKGKDFESYTMLAVKAKYSGPPPTDWRTVQYTVGFEPHLISLASACAEEPLAPTPTGSAAKGSDVLPKKAAVEADFSGYYFS